MMAVPMIVLVAKNIATTAVAIPPTSLSHLYTFPAWLTLCPSSSSASSLPRSRPFRTAGCTRHPDHREGRGQTDSVRGGDPRPCGAVSLARDQPENSVCHQSNTRTVHSLSESLIHLARAHMRLLSDGSACLYPRREPRCGCAPNRD